MWTGILSGLAAGALWGMVFLVPELLPGFSPLELAVGRYVAYGAIALGITLPQIKRLFSKLDANDYAAMVRQALSGNIVYYIFLAAGVTHAGVPATSLIVGMLPLSVILMGRNDQGAAPLRDLAVPLLMIAAAVLSMNVDVFGAAAIGRSPAEKALGIACAIGALACWTYYALDNARYLKRNDHVSGAEWSLLYGISSGAIALVIGVVWFGLQAVLAEPQAVAAEGRNWTTFFIANALLALGASVIGNHLWNIASRRVPVTLCGTLILSETLFAFLYGFLYQQRMPRPFELLAIVLMIAGTFWAVRAHGPEPTPVPAP
ncbi:DMT family transporter [Pseudoduganella sp. GCM10020061]|uniref:DMT family transporter n=1 Tax=Pseudoduganella sp. GCM10020061 TaxID=3317345 RepID=UPI0036264B09